MTKKYFGVISDGIIRKHLNKDTKEEIIEAFNKHYLKSKNNLVGIIDVQTGELVHPVENDPYKKQQRLDVIFYVLNSLKLV